MNDKVYYEFYPSYNDNEIGPIYYIEFYRGPGELKKNWTLFKRRFIYSDEEWKKIKETRQLGNDPLVMLNEGHPWNLGSGVLNDYENAVSMNTQTFLKFMVDALNEKVNRDTKP